MASAFLNSPSKRERIADKELGIFSLSKRLGVFAFRGSEVINALILRRAEPERQSKIGFRPENRSPDAVTFPNGLTVPNSCFFMGVLDFTKTCAIGVDGGHAHDSGEFINASPADNSLSEVSSEKMLPTSEEEASLKHESSSDESNKFDILNVSFSS